MLELESDADSSVQEDNRLKSKVYGHEMQTRNKSCAIDTERNSAYLAFESVSDVHVTT